MDFAEAAQAIARDAFSVVFVNVALLEIGLPVPAWPVLVLAGSLARTPYDLMVVMAAALLPCIVGDWAWYLAGKAFGYRILTGLCRLSLNPASCVTRTEARLSRWGVWTMLFAKLIPGLSLVAAPIAGSLRLPLAKFMVAAALGAIFWEGIALGTGWALRGEVTRFLPVLQRHAGEALGLASLALCVWIGWKIRQRRRFQGLARIPHITVAAYHRERQSAQPPRLLDLRSPVVIAELGPVPGAVPATLDSLAGIVAPWPKHLPIVTLCSCPEDAGAVAAARLLMEMGYRNVRPLRGGYEALAAQDPPPSPLLRGLPDP